VKSTHRTESLVSIILNSRPRTRELLPPRKFPKVVSSESTAQFSTKGRCGKLSKNFYLSFMKCHLINYLRTHHPVLFCICLLDLVKAYLEVTIVVCFHKLLDISPAATYTFCWGRRFQKSPMK
jgi:hypothetical protein